MGVSNLQNLNATCSQRTLHAPSEKMQVYNETALDLCADPGYARAAHLAGLFGEGAGAALPVPARNPDKISSTNRRKTQNN